MLITCCIFVTCDSSHTQTNQASSTEGICTVGFPEGYGEITKNSLLFIDLTDKSIFQENAKAYVKQVIRKRLTSPKDRLTLHYITANTATERAAYTTTLSIPPLAKLVPKATIVNNRKRQVYACNWDEALQKIEAEVLEAIDNKLSTQQESSYINSDLLGLFFTAHNTLSTCNKSASNAIFVVSDMEHYCKQTGGYFGCKQTRFCSSGCGSVIAEGDPRADGTAIRQKLMDAKLFQNVAFDYMRGDRFVSGQNEQVLNQLIDYWQTLSSELGLVKTQEL